MARTEGRRCVCDNSRQWPGMQSIEEPLVTHQLAAEQGGSDSDDGQNGKKYQGAENPTSGTVMYQLLRLTGPTL